MKRNLCSEITLCFFVLFCAALGDVYAGTRSSADYSIATESLDGGGLRAFSSAYTSDSSIGGITGISRVVAPEETVKNGYIGQLYDVIGLDVSAPQQALAGGETLQFSAEQILDDSTVLAVNPNFVVWSTSNGSVLSIDANGLVTAANINQTMSVTVQALYQGNSMTFPLTVLAVGNVADTPTMPPWALCALALLLFVVAGRFLPKTGRNKVSRLRTGNLFIQMQLFFGISDEDI